MDDIDYWQNVKTEKEAMKKVISNEDFNNRTTNDVKLIKENLNFIKEDIVVDYGCGVGRLMLPLCSECKMLVGTDVSDNMIHYAIRNCKDVENTYFSLMKTPSDIKIFNERVDKIYSLLVLQHIDKPSVFSILLEMNRILKYKGKVFLQFPNFSKSHEFYFHYLISKNQLQGLTPRMEFYFKEEIELIMKQSGFKILNFIEDNSDFFVLGEKIMQVNVPYTFLRTIDGIQ